MKLTERNSISTPINSKIISRSSPKKKRVIKAVYSLVYVFAGNAHPYVVFVIPAFIMDENLIFRFVCA